MGRREWNWRHILRLKIGGTNTATTVREWANHTGYVALYLLGSRRRHGQLVQVEVRQLDVDNVPGLGVQPLAPGRVKGAFGLFD
jgi:hypothetical protein